MNTIDKRPISFLELFQMGIPTIPKIQRAYAQGREDTSTREIRKDLLGAIFRALEEGNELALNFVYGSKRSETGEQIELLDGQQRLTTLALLHWYVAFRELREDDGLDIEIRWAIGQYSYQTRATSEAFFKHLGGERLASKDAALDIVSYLRGRSWYTHAMERDASVAGMLVMLGAIEEKYNAMGKVLHENLGLIKFYYLSLEDFGLSEKLYVKMNARGLALTPYENLKADLLEWLRRKCGAEYAEGFGKKMDGAWVEMFCKLSDSDEDWDQAFFLFINVFLLGEWIVMKSEGEKFSLKQEDLETESFFNGLATQYAWKTGKYKGFSDYEQYLRKDHVERLERLLDNLLAFPVEKVEDNWPHKLAREKSDAFFNQGLCPASFTYSYGFMRYLAEGMGDEEGLKTWLRVLWNLLYNTQTRPVRQLRMLARLECHGVEASLAGLDDSVLGRFGGEQLLEEKCKLQLMEQPAWREAIYKAEGSKYFHGGILALLDWGGVVSCSWKTDSREQKSAEYASIRLANPTNSPAKFEAYFRKSRLCFKKAEEQSCLCIEEAEEQRKFLFVRALLCYQTEEFQDYSMPKSSSHKYSLMPREGWSPNAEYPNWCTLLNSPVRSLLKMLLDDIEQWEGREQVNRALDRIRREKGATDWRGAVCNDLWLLKNSQKGLIGWHPNLAGEWRIYLTNERLVNHSARSIDLGFYWFYHCEFKSQMALWNPFTYCEFCNYGRNENYIWLYDAGKEWMFDLRIYREYFTLDSEGEEQKTAYTIFFTYGEKRRGDSAVQEGFARMKENILTADLGFSLDAEDQEWLRCDLYFAPNQKEKELEGKILEKVKGLIAVL